MNEDRESLGGQPPMMPLGGGGQPPRGQPPVMPLGPPQSPPLPNRRPRVDPEMVRRRRRIWMTVVAVLFGFPTLVTAALRSPMAFVFGFLLLFFVVLGLAMFWPPRRQ